MDLTDILIRSMSGYIFIVPVIVCYLVYLKKKDKPLSLIRTILLFVFSYYIIGILTMTGIGKLHSFSPRLVLTPSEDLIKLTIDTILNVILFLPLGFFLPFMYKNYKNVGKIVLTGFLLSLSIEIVQMFGRGATDVNDLITNTLGTILGYLFYKILSKFILKKINITEKSNIISNNIELTIIIILSYIIMITIQAWIISKFFGLG